MLNKKILAAAVVAGLSSTANAAVNITDNDAALTIASETVGALNGDGLLAIASNVAADVEIEAGFTVSAGTSKYVRIELTNGEFDLASASMTAAGVANFSATVSQGGTDGDDYVIFEITSTSNDVAADSVLTLVNNGYAISDTAGLSLSYALYETAADAVNELNALSSDSQAILTVGTGSTGDFASSNTRISTVASSFLKFDTANADTTLDAISTLIADLGEIDGNNIVGSATYTPALVAVTAGDLITTTQDITVAGDFSYGTFELQTSATCAGAGTIAATVATDMASAAFTGVDLVTVPYYLCLTVDGANDVIQKDTYEVTLDDDGLTNDVGTIKYDTTSIEVPYLTTFSDYNQRFYIVNYGTTDAAYSFTFVSEDGVVATDGASVSGNVPAGEMLTIKAVDIVTLTGKTRTSAIIEVEATDADVAASTQVVNLGNSGTDTIVLN